MGERGWAKDKPHRPVCMVMEKLLFLFAFGVCVGRGDTAGEGGVQGVLIHKGYHVFSICSLL